MDRVGACVGVLFARGWSKAERASHCGGHALPSLTFLPDTTAVERGVSKEQHAFKSGLAALFAVHQYFPVATVGQRMAEP